MGRGSLLDPFYAVCLQEGGWKQKLENEKDKWLCCVCLEHQISIAWGCGHVLCSKCAPLVGGARACVCDCVCEVCV